MNRHKLFQNKSLLAFGPRALFAASFLWTRVQDETWPCLIKLPTAYHPYNLNAVAVGELSGLKIAALYGLTIHFD
jgi:hypothetical protein